MQALTADPVLGHITTFGGHPVCCAAGMAAMKVLLEERLIDTVEQKASRFRSLLTGPNIKAILSFGLWLAVEFDSLETNMKIIDECIRQGIVTDCFLFAPNCLRISSSLVIEDIHIKISSTILILAGIKAIGKYR